MQWKEYPYEKNILLNTVYDVLEHLNYPMKNADSKAGKLQLSHYGRRKYLHEALYCKYDLQLLLWRKHFLLLMIIMKISERKIH